ncbi:hypothetical protein [Microbacterium sp.]|uniref:hypothetical protein n=1 Tax=Microbacterium sp. TaxID=51671 RepID=UPI0039E2825A
MADSVKRRAWAIFDRIVSDAAPNGEFTSPWREGVYEPDWEVLQKLLGAALYLKAKTTTQVPALALDVWTAYELRRAGFAPDAVWPRAEHPRVMPRPIAALIPQVYRDDKAGLLKKLAQQAPMTNVVATDARILGKHYMKQVDVVMSSWETGPELLISTKRMDSSFGKNAANRVEESYGDAKNLRSRHPLAALGFLYALRSTILTTEPDKALWLIDLLTKLGQEDDAYDAVGLIMLDYEVDGPEDSDGGLADEDALEGAGIADLHTADAEDDAPDVALSEVDDALRNLPVVHLRHDVVPDRLQAGRFLAEMVLHVLAATPVNFHADARYRYLNGGGS